VLICDNDNEDDMTINGEYRLLREVLPDANTVFDVGANVGKWTRAALAINPNLLIHCFEPSAVTYSTLVANDFPANVYGSNCALGDSTRHETLHMDPANSGGNSLYRRKSGMTAPSTTETISVRTLDDYCLERGIEHIDLLKIDVEGHELAVLRGGQEMLRQGRISIIQFEYGGTYLDARILLKDIWDLVTMVAPAYRFYKLYPTGPKLIPAYQQSLETFLQSNWVIQKAA